MRIVLVDQSRTIVRIVSELIQADAHAVIGFTDAHKALACLAADPEVRALIASVQLHSLSGIELCAAARQMAGSRRPLYVILMSSSDDRDIVVQALDRGADDFIRKPPDVEELRARLRLADRVTSMQRELIRHGTTDSLTGLLNRREFFQRSAELEKTITPEMPLSAIMLDIDHFKQINDAHGHEAGDRAIAAVAAQINLLGAVSGRLGGEEFCMLVQDDLDHAISTAEYLRSAIAGMSFHADGNQVAVRASFGVARWKAGDTIDRLLRRADIALYRAKNAGRNCVIAAEDDAGRHYPVWRSIVRTGNARR
jgi:two-component system, cell cycle response regulator